jgi:hypothetical protein
MKGHVLIIIGVIPLVVFILWPTVDYIVFPGWQSVMVPAKSVYTLAGLLIFGLLGLVYWQLNKANRRTTPLLTLAHVLLTFLPVYFLIWQIYLYDLFGNRAVVRLYQLMLWSYLMLIVGQVLFVANVGWSLIRKT